MKTPRTDAKQKQQSHPYNIVKSDGWAFARALEIENEALRATLKACVEEMKYSAKSNQPISEDRREFEMAGIFLENR